MCASGACTRCTHFFSYMVIYLCGLFLPSLIAFCVPLTRHSQLILNVWIWTYINQKGAGVAKLARAPGAPNTKVLGWKCCKYLFQDFSLKLIHFVYFLILNSIASQIWNNVFWKILKNKTLKQFILINVSFLNI